ncbi:MAG TPA: hypothetical protein VKU93_05675 [Terracidiphilus sp.]|nr:hypothetical protein [Terracidiphilus sp.]
MNPLSTRNLFGYLSLFRPLSRTLSGFSLLGLILLLAPRLFADSQRLIPAGSLVSCTTGDARISSKTTAPGDPVLCKVEHRRGDFMLPYGSYLGGEFSEYKDPGHFVGKGWMLLSFDRLYVGDTVVPIDAKVVDVPGYKIDAQGRIIGKGHAVRDTVEWMIPVLWPIDLINLPRRGPRPTLKAETALTLRVMEDIVVPETPEPQRDPYGLIPRGQGENDEPAPPAQDQQPAPQMGYDDQPAPPPAYAPPPPPVVAYAAPMPPPYFVAPPPAFVAYGGFFAGPRVAYGYGPRFYAGRPFAGYAPRAYGYGYARGYAGGGRVAAGFGGGFRGR